MILFSKPLPEYKTLDEKKQFFAPESVDYKWIINTPKEFDDLYAKLVDEFNKDFESRRYSLLFRGVNEARYKTFTSAQRYWLSNDWQNPSRQGFVNYINTELRNIKQNGPLKHFYRSLNVIPNDFLYLTFLQHFGGASPMLDLTHSLDMGLFFAIDGVKPGSNTGGIDDYISLQIFDYRNYELLSIVNLVDMLHSGMETAIQSVEDFKAHHPDMDVDDSLIQSIDKFTRWVDPGNPGGGLSDISIGLLDYANPKKVTDKKGRTLYWSNLRLMAQRGVMLLYTDMDFSLEEYICQHNAPLLRCINIHKSLCDHIRSRLPFGREKVYPSEEQMAKDSNIRALNSLRK